MRYLLAGRRWITILVALVGVSAVVAACGDDSSDGGAAKRSGDGLTQLRLAASGGDTYPIQGMLGVAINKGWFEEEGLAVTLLAGAGGGDTMRVVSTGSADLALTSGISVVLAAQNPDLNVKVIGPWYQVNENTWMTPDANASLDGATLGVTSAGSTSEAMAKAIQAKEPDAGIKVVPVGSPGANWAAAKAGEITAGLSVPPYSMQLRDEEGAETLVAGRDVLGDVPTNLAAVNTEYAEENPEALKAFWRVADRATKYARENPAAAAKDLAELIPIDTKYLKEAIVEYEQGYDITVRPDALANLSDLMVSTGVVEAPVDWAELMDQQFLPEAARADLARSAN